MSRVSSNVTAKVDLRLLKAAFNSGIRNDIDELHRKRVPEIGKAIEIEVREDRGSLESPVIQEPSPFAIGRARMVTLPSDRLTQSSSVVS